MDQKQQINFEKWQWRDLFPIIGQEPCKTFPGHFTGMQMLSFRYIAFHYFKYFSVIMIALVFFMVGFDYMENVEKLPDSANLVLIYLMYKSFFAIDMLLPLSLAFGMIATKIFLIRSNALVAMYSLGYSKNDILKPFVFVASLVLMVYIALHSTSFARADEYSNNIRSTSQYLRPTSNLFFTYEDKYVYFGRLYPLQEKADDIRIFSIKEHALHEVLVAKQAHYSDGYWHIAKAHLIGKPDALSFTGAGISVEEKEGLRLLRDFRPKILDQVYEGKVNFTIIDAIDAVFLLKEQEINIDRVKSALYRIFIYPFFVPSLIVIIFFFVPVSPRFLNVTLFSFGAILAVLMTWAILFVLTELAINKTISSEAGIVVPIVLLFLAALMQLHRHRVRS
jgi:lipopolysaccharide export system permease protein